MTTTRKTIVLFVIVFFSLMLTACSGDLSTTVRGAVASAYDDGEAPASVKTVLYSARIDGCSTSETAQIEGHIKGDIKAASEAAGKELGSLDITTSAWLDSEMQYFGCVAQASQE